MTIDVEHAPPAFRDWETLLALLRAAFAYQDERIDPPSSVLRLNTQSLEQKAQVEHLFVAIENGTLLGCVFAKPGRHAMYVGKLAVWPHQQRRGIGRRLMRAAEGFARRHNFAAMELETRIKLTENHRTFEALGFAKTGEHAHPGYDRPTFITMRKDLT